MTIVPQSDVLNSWKEVSSYIGRGVRTVQRWEKDFGLPVRRPSGHLRGSVIALKTDIDNWLGSRHAREAEKAADSNGNGRAELKPVHENYQRLKKSAETLKLKCERLEFSTKALESNLRQTKLLRER